MLEKLRTDVEPLLDKYQFAYTKKIKAQVIPWQQWCILFWSILNVRLHMPDYFLLTSVQLLT